ncbi:uncharacterized protein Dvar_55660 [Desulfosarcina variabilis str. Montpellier]|uniref:PilC/PilY family type IV pilus protein n=1 Tax=Desulfosarcina variabilis TaxID=2300 RepID=UPI003AFAB588
MNALPITQKKKNPGLRIIIAAMGVWLAIIAGNPHTAGASCMDLADIPLDALEQAAPGMIMFVMDDSGSMDWSIMCPPAQEGSGVFNGSYYVFSERYTADNLDNEYGYGSLEGSSSNRMRWMSQWAGYNGLYYDPTTEYTPWPTFSDADPDLPLSNPVISGYQLDMTAMWHEWDEYGIIVDNDDASGFALSVTGTGNGYWYRNTSGAYYDTSYHYSIVNSGTETFTAKWTATGLDTSTTYDVYAWCRGGNSTRIKVDYVTYADTTVTTEIDQATQYGAWYPIASGVSFSSGTGVVEISEVASTSQVDADAVKFVPADSPISNIARRHYYVQNGNGTYLVNLLNGVIEYYQVNLDSATDNREVVSADKLVKLTDAEAATAGIVTGRTYAEEVQNFANWYSFYRRRELTAKNAIANVIDTSDGIFIGLFFINDYHSKDQRVLPIKVNLDGTFYDDSTTLLNILYNYQIDSYGTPLRLGLKKAGRFFSGAYEKPSTFISQVNSGSYPYFIADKGGTCQQAFTIIFTDGYYNGSSPSVGNEDGNGDTDYDGSPFGDSSSDTLADVAMKYYEDDLNTYLSDSVPITTVDPANHQHMVTYTVAFGVTGTLNTELYEDCSVGGTCPSSWPSTSGDTGKIDDMFHAAVNGRGKFISAQSTAELNEALGVLKNDIDSRLGAAAALATNSIQRTVESVIYQGTYNTSNWYGEVSALPVNVTSGAVGSSVWDASGKVPAWDSRTILSYNGTSGIVFDAANLSGSQSTQLTASGLGTAAEIVDFIRGDTSKNVAHSGVLRTRNHIFGDIVHSAPTYFKGTLYIGANDGMLHAFDATPDSTGGTELFAYVPGLVYDHLAELADPGYSHKFYVDNTATVADIGSQDVLVCGLGKGGKGYFALDVTTPTAMDAGKVLWEYPDGTDNDMGYSYSRALIVNTQAEGYVAVFGNGYDSTNGEAVLYVLKAETGTLLKQLKTGVTGCNGLSTPAAVDMDLNGVVEYVFAGDLKGNMWKFDLRGTSKDDWAFSYMDGATPKPLITVQNASGSPQPITASPEVMLDCVHMDEGRGLMVIFGTGQYLNSNDFSDSTVQSMYGIWDWGPMWNLKNDLATAQSKYLGTLGTDRSLPTVGGSVGLLEQIFEYETAEWVVLSDNPINWYDPVAGTGDHMGWVIDLTKSGERIVQMPMIKEEIVVFVSTIPSSSPCDAGGSSLVYQFLSCSGARSPSPQFDVNNNNLIGDDDVITTAEGPLPPSGESYATTLFGPLLIGPRMYFQDPTGQIPEVPTTAVLPGMFYWRVLGL